jgi:hypothetical protein
MATTLTALDRKSFVTRVTAFIGKREISRYNAGESFSSYRLEHVLADVQRYARYNEEDGIPSQYGLTAYGIGWAIETGRINGVTHIALKAMSVRELLILVHKVHEACANMGEIPAYLMGLNLQPAA